MPEQEVELSLFTPVANELANKYSLAGMPEEDIRRIVRAVAALEIRIKYLERSLERQSGKYECIT